MARTSKTKIGGGSGEQSDRMMRASQAGEAAVQRGRDAHNQNYERAADRAHSSQKQAVSEIGAGRRADQQEGVTRDKMKQDEGISRDRMAQDEGIRRDQMSQQDRQFQSSQDLDAASKGLMRNSGVAAVVQAARAAIVRRSSKLRWTRGRSSSPAV